MNDSDDEPRESKKLAPSSSDDGRSSPLLNGNKSNATHQYNINVNLVSIARPKKQRITYFESDEEDENAGKISKRLTKFKKQKKCAYNSVLSSTWQLSYD